MFVSLSLLKMENCYKLLSVCFTIVIVAIVKLQNLCFANIAVGTVYDQPLASIFMLSIIFSEGERDKMFQILIR